MNLNQSDLVLLPFPFSDNQGSKVRPALVISNNSYNKKSADCIMVPLTTVIKDEPYSIIIEQKDLEEGKLLKKSRIKFDKIFSIEKKLVVMKIGKLNVTAFEKLKSRFFKMF